MSFRVFSLRRRIFVFLRRVSIELVCQFLLNIADISLLFGGRWLVVAVLFVKLDLPLALFLTASLLAKFIPEGCEAHEKLLRVGALGLINLTISPKLEPLEKAEKFGECELTEDFMRENQFGSLLHLILTGRVVDTKEGKGLGNVEAEPKGGGLFTEKLCNGMKRRSIGRYCFLDTHRLLILAEYQFAIFGAKAVESLDYLVLTSQ